MDIPTATAIISRFLLPRVRAYMECKSRSPAYRDYYSSDLALLSPCEVCYEPTFGGHWCLGCRDTHAADPAKFARDNLLCENCFMPEDAWGCKNMCQGWEGEMNRQADEEEDERDRYNSFNRGRRSKRKYSRD